MGKERKDVPITRAGAKYEPLSGGFADHHVKNSLGTAVVLI